MPVLVVRVQREDLREVLHVDAGPPGRTVKALYNKRRSLHPGRLFGQTPDVTDGNEADLGHGDAYGPRQLEHDKFVLRHGPELCGGQLDDPGPTHAVSWDGETAGRFHDGGELQLHTGERKPQQAIIVAVTLRLLLVLLILLVGP